MDEKTRHVMTVCVSIVSGVIAVSAILSLAGVIRNPNPPTTLAGIAIFAVGANFAYIWGLKRSRVVLHPESIEVTRFLSRSRRVVRSDIVARRRGGRRARYDILITRDGNEVKLPPYLKHSTTFQTWRSAIPLQRRYERKTTQAEPRHRS
jgi:hypothetical protein